MEAGLAKNLWFFLAIQKLYAGAELARVQRVHLHPRFLETLSFAPAVYLLNTLNARLVLWGLSLIVLALAYLQQL